MDASDKDDTTGAPLAVEARDLADPRQRYGLTWRIGDVTVTKIVEVEVVGDLASSLANVSREKLLALPWLQPYFLTAEGLGITSIHALVVEAPGRRILVDTCIGNDKDRAAIAPMFDRAQGPFLRDLTAAGFPRENIDTVLCTHLHFDHVGWNTMLVEGRWVPTFPNARYLLSEIEFRHWQEGARNPDGSEWGAIQQTAFIDSVQPLLDAGQVDLVEGAHRICDEVSLIPTPGHSPGHVSVRIQSGGEEAVITGDATHHPCQLAHLDWGSLFDLDAGAATRMRSQLFEDCAGRPVLVIGTHWAGVSAGRIVADGDAYRLAL